MAARYTEVTLEEIERFLKRGFRVLRPKEGTDRGEVYYDLFLSPLVAIRVWTSIAKGREQAAGVGQDAIRVQLRGVKTNRPLMKGKAAIVKRTQNWRNSLQNRIEDLIEAYEDREDYWEARAGGEAPSQAEEDPSTGARRPPPGDEPTDKQIRFVMVLLRNVGPDDWRRMGLDRRFNSSDPFTEAEVRQMTRKQVSALIGALKDSGFGRRYGNEDLDDDYDYNRSA